MKVTSFVPPVEPVFTVEMTKREAEILRLIVGNKSASAIMDENSGSTAVSRLTSEEASEWADKLYNGLDELLKAKKKKH